MRQFVQVAERMLVTLGSVWKVSPAWQVNGPTDLRDGKVNRGLASWPQAQIR